ncbi:tripartite tricarboxylate transporter substrate binding protein [Paraburkholderia jirisanensis]
MFRFIKRIATAALVAAAVTPAAPVHAAAFPSRQIRLIVPFAPGGASDVIARIIGKKLTQVLGQPVVVFNRPGAGGTIGVDFTARAPADGYTITLVNAIQQTTSKEMYPNLTYDPVKSFRPLATIGSVHYVLVVNPSFPAKDYASFVNTVKGQPGKYSYASPGIGSAPNLVMEQFKQAAGLNIVHVPYLGSGPALNDVIANHVPVSMDNVAAIPLIKSGMLRAIATTGDTRSPALPDVPTFAQAGLGSFNVAGVWGFLAPAGIPDEAAATLNNAIRTALQDPQVKQGLANQGLDPAYGSADQFGATLAAETTRWAALFAAGKIKR